MYKYNYAPQHGGPDCVSIWYLSSSMTEVYHAGYSKQLLIFLAQLL